MVEEHLKLMIANVEKLLITKIESTVSFRAVKFHTLADPLCSPILCPMVLGTDWLEGIQSSWVFRKEIIML